MTGSRLKPEEKQEIEDLTAEGLSAKKIGKRLQRSPHTIQKHVADPEACERIAEKLETVAERAIDSIGERDYAKASLVAKLTAAGIAIDKRQLLKGQPTSINVTVLLDAVQAIRAMRTAEDAARPRLPPITE